VFFVWLKRIRNKISRKTFLIVDVAKFNSTTYTCVMISSNRYRHNAFSIVFVKKLPFQNHTFTVWFPNSKLPSQRLFPSRMLNGYSFCLLCSFWIRKQSINCSCLSICSLVSQLFCLSLELLYKNS